MKTAIVFYSLDENCHFIAKQLKKALNADLIRLETVDSKKRGKIGKIIWGVAMVMFKKMPPLKPYNFDPSAYDLIIMGVPVWGGTPAPPIRTFLSQTKISGKKIALFISHGGEPGKAIDEFKALLEGNTFVGELELKDPIKSEITETVHRLENWAKELEK